MLFVSVVIQQNIDMKKRKKKAVININGSQIWS